MTGIERSTLSGRVYRRIRDLIVSGAIPPGSRLDELSLVQNLGVSRTPIREAVAMLVKEGLVEHRPYRGNFVGEFTMKQIDDLYELRMVLEEFAVRLAVPRLTDEQLEALGGFLEEAERALHEGDIAAYGVADRHFHKALAEYSGNKYLIDSLDRLSLQVDVVRGIANHDPDVVKRTAEERPRIVAALTARDGDEAATLLREHISGVHQAVRAELMNGRHEHVSDGVADDPMRETKSLLTVDDN